MGTGFAIVKHDVGGNIDRLAACQARNPAAYDPDLFQMVRDAGGGGCCALPKVPGIHAPRALPPPPGAG